MLEQIMETEERQVGGEGRGTRSEDGGGGLLRKAIPFAAAFVAGFLLGQRREDGEAAETEKGSEGQDHLSEAATEVRERATAGATAGETATGTEAGATDAEEATDHPTTDQPTTDQPTTDQPSSMGSVSGEEARQEEREDEEGQAAAGEETSEAQSAETEAAGIDAEVAELSPPTTHGMPMFGLGTYQMEEYDECVEAVRRAIQMGYRHIDTAEGYDNEDAVGDAIVEAEIERDDLFVATKIGPQHLDYDHVLTNAADSFDRLGVDYVDLLYVHWPTGEYEATDTLEAFAELRQEDLIGEIGVSNFTVEQLEEAIEVSEEPIFANQVEMHPLLPQTELRQFCAQDDVDVELVAYSPIARGDVADVEELQEVADKHDATPQQVSLAWLREKEVTAIPKATSEEHLRENWLSLGLELDGEDVEKIDAIDERQRIVDPDEAPWNQ